MKIIKTIAVVLVLCMLCGCAASIADVAGNDHAGKARVLVYLHVKDGKRPPLLSFTLAVSGLKRKGGASVPLAMEAKPVNAAELFGKQILLGEYFAEPGQFDALEFKISAASLGGADVTAKLSGGGSYSLPVKLDTRSGGSVVVNMEWDAVASVASQDDVAPAMTASVQQGMTPNLMLFVVNEGSGYVSVIDVDKERVIGAVSVGKGPTSIAMSDNGIDAYVLNAADGTVSVLDTAVLNVRETIVPLGGVGTREMAYVKTGQGAVYGKLYIVNEISQNVTVVDTATRLTSRTIPVGSVPVAIAAHKDRKEIYVANSASNSISVISASSDSVVATVRVSLRPKGLAVHGDNLYVFDDAARAIAVVSLSQRAESMSVPVVHSVNRGVAAFGGRLFASDSESGELLFFSSIGVAASSIAVEKGIFDIAVDEFRNRLYITGRSTSSVYVADSSSQRLEKTLTVGDKPYGMARFE